MIKGYAFLHVSELSEGGSPLGCWASQPQQPPQPACPYGNAVEQRCIHTTADRMGYAFLHVSELSEGGSPLGCWTSQPQQPPQPACPYGNAVEQRCIHTTADRMGYAFLHVSELSEGGSPLGCWASQPQQPPQPACPYGDAVEQRCIHTIADRMGHRSDYRNHSLLILLNVPSYNTVCANKPGRWEQLQLAGMLERRENKRNVLGHEPLRPAEVDAVQKRACIMISGTDQAPSILVAMQIGGNSGFGFISILGSDVWI
ncbi:hypothetical protein BC939DRAFT_513882 [Gamsiella multidivaricata]|uniref:uncharacterized protein n=1 Tax=Gamsiella multidivaricata TaxID=101098 RepID=UPI00222127EE|nr:uncharacterized protein BC939DRAFT_513882 [Gamsiella multidivaricata]KAI7832220.1 hypothetical protein BC939DRAFT_513882 [Gamsiella multidivaricata]